MNWKFWEKSQKQDKSSHVKAEKLPKPKSIPEAVGRFLVVQLGKNPDWVWRLKGVVRKRQGGSPSSYDVRIFDENDRVTKGVSVKDYTSLDGRPDLILFEGWFDKKSFEVHLDEKEKPPVMPKAA